MRKFIFFIFLVLSIPNVLSSQPINNKNIHRRAESYLTLTDSGEGIDRIVTIESVGQFRLVFEAADNWGISQWYDLVNDPEANINLAYSTKDDPGNQEPGLFQMVWQLSDPVDTKLFMFAAKYNYPDEYRSFTIIKNSEDHIIVESVSHPLLIAGVDTNITVKIKSSIYPDGKIYINAQTHVDNSKYLGEWRCAVIGLCDSTNLDYLPVDQGGWIRASTTQNPYEYSKNIEKYLFAYWSKSTPEPFNDWTKASIMLVSSPYNEHISRQNRHTFHEFKRWYYTCDDVSMNAGDTIIHNYLIQLGTENSSILPNLIDSSVANPIANAYIADPTPPDSIASVDNKNKSIPIDCSIIQNYPNPFNQKTIINYSLPITCHLSLGIYDITGKKIKTLVDEVKPAGTHTAEWYGTDKKGNKVRNGIYICNISTTSGSSDSRKMILLK